MTLDITQLRSTKLDTEDLYTIELDEYDMAALVDILGMIAPSYSDYGQPYTRRYRQARVIVTLLANASALDITPRV